MQECKDGSSELSVFLARGTAGAFAASEFWAMCGNGSSELLGLFGKSNVRFCVERMLERARWLDAHIAGRCRYAFQSLLHVISLVRAILAHYFFEKRLQSSFEPHLHAAKDGAAIRNCVGTTRRLRRSDSRGSVGVLSCLGLKSFELCAPSPVKNGSGRSRRWVALRKTAGLHQLGESCKSPCDRLWTQGVYTTRFF